MNLKPIIAWTFGGSLLLLLFYFILSKFLDCSTPITGMWQGFNAPKNSLCSVIDAVKMLAYGGFIISAVLYLIHYFGSDDKYPHY
ncbi:hypothetical protein HIO71_12215 [Chryseobacterium aquaticum]|uniref:Uncharacterized protein n=1 Tax=Chryseobacterium aquaticum TaxID=452084 RepID=A0A848N910_9FLAO|nr:MULTISPECIES: hypothetical protein [Chryseobacterium]NMR34951.1 hypothetical protein [Chryseobacterium aquaticum]NRQ47185.1 hypothetical protein [Chryseobacterium sp. C-204]